jgi:hypothetical protein
MVTAIQCKPHLLRPGSIPFQQDVREAGRLGGECPDAILALSAASG